MRRLYRGDIREKRREGKILDSWVAERERRDGNKLQELGEVVVIDEGRVVRSRVVVENPDGSLSLRRSRGRKKLF